MEAKTIGMLETENNCLRLALEELLEKMEQNEAARPGTCQYCKYYAQHYIRGGYPAFTKEYIAINEGHCTRGIPVKKGGKRSQGPFDRCPFYEIGNHRMRMQDL